MGVQKQLMPMPPPFHRLPTACPCHRALACVQEEIERLKASGAVPMEADEEEGSEEGQQERSGGSGDAGGSRPAAQRRQGGGRAARVVEDSEEEEEGEGGYESPQHSY